jgi:two-component system heavy metal sensor histidine kinase CusS
VLKLGQRSITLRLTLLFAAVSTSVLLLLGLVVGTLVERHFEELDMELLDGKLELIGHALANIQSSDQFASLAPQLATALIGHHGLAVSILAPDGQPVFEVGDAEFPLALLAEAMARPAVPMLWNNTIGQRFRGLAIAAPTGIGGAKSAVVAVATDIAHHEHFMHSFRSALWTVVGLAALLSGLLGWLAARRGLAPLQEMRQKAAAITANRLDQRLVVDAIPVELAEVAASLNEMLARLQTSFRRLSDFSSDLAHELRTPVSNLLTQTQVSLSRSRTVAEYQDVLASNAEEFERLSRMIADMLFLAKADNELIVPHRETVDLGQEVDGLLEFYEALAEEKGIGITRQGSAQVAGDRLMLRRAISNLLSNALRHTPHGGRIAVRIENAENQVRLLIENSGESIPAEHLPRLFDRFYRVDPSRHRQADGAGLGLAITRSILRAHGGDALVRSNDGLTTFELSLPR